MIDISKFVFITIFILKLNYVLSCQLEISGSSPLFTKEYGSRTIVFKTLENKLILEEGETVNAYCKGLQISGEHNSYGYPQTDSAPDDTVIFSCASNSITTRGRLYNYIQVSCSSHHSLDLYESNKKLPKCTNFMNYAIGVKVKENADLIKAGICYDLDGLQLKFVSFVLHYKKFMTLDKFHIENGLSLNLRQKLNGLDKYFDFVNMKSADELKALAKSSFNINEFNFESILQDDELKSELHEFNYMLNIMWWRQLREGNWNFFLQALNERSQTTQYVINMGTFGNVTIPKVQGNCSLGKSEVVSIESENMIVKAPGYIWAYLKSITPGVDEEFVVIGHNSPYKRDPDHTEFCAVDICDDIEWLKNSQFGNLRHLPTLGYTFCCPPEDVAVIIDYFPFKVNKIESTTQQIPLWNPLMQI